MNLCIYKYFYKIKTIKRLFKKSILHSNNPKILVGTLFSGENELNQCIDSLNSQKFRLWDQVVLENLPNKEAHDQLYNYFMKKSNKYDLFMKLDADMVLAENDVLDYIIKKFTDDLELDHLQLMIKDWYTNTMIWGVHIYSNRAKWVMNDEKLFVDLPPIIPGRRIDHKSNSKIIAYHSPDPSNLQALRFGIHRGLKAFQYEKVIKDEMRANFQKQILLKVINNYIISRDLRHGLVIIGAKLVHDNNVDATYYSSLNSNKLTSLLVEYSSMSNQEIYKLIMDFRKSVFNE